MADQSKPVASTDRRTVLRATAIGMAAAGVGVTAAACSSNNSVPQGSSATTATAAATSTGPVTVATTSQVPVGGGFVDTTARIVVTQPSAGEYKAFTAVCTHAQCTVSSVSNNVIQCPCHGSQYSAKDGSVIQGPATQSLAAETIKVSGSNIVLEA
jgi:Rieske Fe-S protein